MALAQPAMSPKTVTVKAPSGDIGTAVLTSAPTGVVIRIDVKGLTPGWHGMHLHEKGDCSDPKFTTAGAHINHADMKVPHGLLNPAGPDYGDLPNLFVAADGTGRAEVFTSLIKLSALIDADGSALVIHANPDDGMTQPIGGAGDRVACAVIK
ncbi:superoxide dismutase family protein [soil metagenome]